MITSSVFRSVSGFPSASRADTTNWNCSWVATRAGTSAVAASRLAATTPRLRHPVIHHLHDLLPRQPASPRTRVPGRAHCSPGSCRCPSPVAGEPQPPSVPLREQALQLGQLARFDEVSVEDLEAGAA